MSETRGAPRQPCTCYCVYVVYIMHALLVRLMPKVLPFPCAGCVLQLGSHLLMSMLLMLYVLLACDG
jgi:hypothetical protein